MNLSNKEKFDIVVKNNENFDGVFFYGVKSTGIYCRPSCKSKTPKEENTVFFNSKIEAENDGFRPCKRCRSDLFEFSPNKEIAVKVKKAIELMFLENLKLNDEIFKVGLSQRQMVEVFKKEYNMTPKAYMDKLRLQQAKNLLKTTDKEIIDIALSVGFSSISAFYKFFKENTNTTPKAYRKNEK